MNLEFKKLTLYDIPRVRSYWSMSKRRICDFTTGGIMMWRDFFQIEYAIVKNTVIFKLIYGDQVRFTFPIGEDIIGGILKIREYCINKKLNTIFCTLTMSDVEFLKQCAELKVENERDWADYIYDARSMATYEGTYYKKQRNHVNFFVKNHPDWTYESIKYNNLAEIDIFYKYYTSSLDYDNYSSICLEEHLKTAEVICHYWEYGLDGAYIKIEGNKIVGFTIGEIVNDVLYVHIEKADKSYRGAHQLLAKEFVRHNMKNGILYINREEDVGDQGLRFAKLSCHPINIIEKYTVTVLCWKGI